MFNLSAKLSETDCGVTVFVSNPTLGKEINPNLFPIITGSQVAKGMLLGGAGLEVVGLGLTPLEGQREYIRNVGLFNSITPIAYKATDIGLMLGKFSALGVGDVAFSLADKLGVKYKGESIRAYDTYLAKDLGLDDLATTPTFSGTEKQMLELSQNVEQPGAGAVYNRFGIDPKQMNTFSGIRSGTGKLGKEVLPGVIYYEGGKGSFFAPKINPIAMRQTGLYSKLFSPEPGLYSEYGFGSSKPYLEFRTTKSATAITLKNKFSQRAYDKLKNIFGYKNLDKFFSKEVNVGGISAPKGKTLAQIDYDKIIGKKMASVSSRPVKSREFIGLIGEKAWVENFVSGEGSSVQQLGGFYSSQSRSIGATKELEFMTSGKGIRAEPVTSARKLATKLGFSDAYVLNKFEAVPMNYTLGVNSNLPVIYKGVGEKLLGSNLPSVSEKGLVKVYQNPKLLNYSPVVTGQKGGYSKELERLFGTEGKPIYKDISRFVALPVSSQSQSELDSYNKKYDSSYTPSYTPKYSPKYISTYSPSYTKVYAPSYPTKYTPSYPTTYTPSYTTKYTPSYEPTYEPKYTPPYTPSYTPKYTPPYTPNYPIKYTPNYPLKYTPTYPPIPKLKYYPKTPFPSEKSFKKKGKGYLTFIRRKGKAVRISREPLSYGLALEQGKQATRTGLSQSFFIKTFGSTRYEDTMTPNLSAYRLKKPSSRIREQVFIEKNPLATKSEVKQIQQAKKSKRSLFG